MLAATLDTSCALNFLGCDETANDALANLVAAAIAGRLHLRVTEAAHEEVSRTEDEALRRQRLTRLQAFGRVELPPHRVAERDKLAAALHLALFAQAKPGSRTDRHNRADCVQLATHATIGRDVFVTLDGKLLRKAQAAATHDLVVVDPETLCKKLESDALAGRLPSPPAIALRDVRGDEDEAAVREVLAPLADDYPDFSSWLTSTLAKTTAGHARIRLGLVGERVGAVALSSRKDERVVKLSAFFVSPWARESGLCQHLLWSELRTWAREDVEKVYVSVSSRHADLIGFFHAFGFLVEGVSPRRYQADTAEFVLGKHFIRRVVANADLPGFASDIASRVFAAPQGAAPEPAAWALPRATSCPSFGWVDSGASTRLVAMEDGHVARSWSLLDLERTFHPVRFDLVGRKALIVPIRPRWAESMLEYANQQQSLLTSDASDKLLLRAENAYYCHPTALAVAQAGTPILFSVSGGPGLVGEARIVDAVVDVPEELFARFGGLGIYGIGEIRGHVRRGGEHDGHTLAMRFGSYVAFPSPVSYQRMCAVLGRDLQVQTITPVANEEFEELRRTGGLTW